MSYCSGYSREYTVPFLNLSDHVRLARTCSVMIYTAGILPSPHPKPPLPPPSKHIAKKGAWKKSVILPENITDNQFKAFCQYAYGMYGLECQELSDLSALVIISIVTNNYYCCCFYYSNTELLFLLVL